MRHRIVLWGWFIRRQRSDFEGGSESSDWTGVWDSCRTTFPSEGKCQRMENPQPQIQCLLDWWLIDYKCSTRFIKFTVGIGSQNWTYNEILYLIILYHINLIYYGTVQYIAHTITRWFDKFLTQILFYEREIWIIGS